MRRAAIGVALVGATAVGVLLTGALDPDREDTRGDTLSVFAAASLTEVIEEAAHGFEAAHPDVDVRVTYGGSSDLATQIREGAPADVFLSANESQMDAVAALVSGEPVVFATNTLTLVTPAGNPAGVTGLADLARADVISVICAPQVPCGAATASLARLAGVALAPASEEQSVTDVLGKVASGQADAGVVYVTDAARAQGVEAVPIAGAEAVVNRYPAAALAGAWEPAVPELFVEYLAGPEARAVLTAAGFGAP